MTKTLILEFDRKLGNLILLIRRFGLLMIGQLRRNIGLMQIRNLELRD